MARYLLRPALHQSLQSGGGEEPSLVTDGLVAWYRCNEGSGQVLTDYSGNGHHAYLGSISDQADTNDPTWESGYLDHDPTDDRITFPSAIQIANQLQHTLQILVRSSATGGPLLYSEGNTGTTEFVYIERNATVDRVLARYRRTTATAYDVSVNTGNSSMLDDTWALITLRRDGVNADICLNNLGNSGMTTSLGATALPTRTNIYTNSPAGTSVPAVSGCDVAEFVVYHRYLSDAELTLNYQRISAAHVQHGITLP